MIIQRMFFDGLKSDQVDSIQKRAAVPDNSISVTRDSNQSVEQQRLSNIKDSSKPQFGHVFQLDLIRCRCEKDECCYKIVISLTHEYCHLLDRLNPKGGPKGGQRALFFYLEIDGKNTDGKRMPGDPGSDPHYLIDITARYVKLHNTGVEDLKYGFETDDRDQWELLTGDPAYCARLRIGGCFCIEEDVSEAPSGHNVNAVMMDIYCPGSPEWPVFEFVSDSDFNITCAPCEYEVWLEPRIICHHPSNYAECVFDVFIEQKGGGFGDGCVGSIDVIDVRGVGPGALVGQHKYRGHSDRGALRLVNGKVMTVKPATGYPNERLLSVEIIIYDLCGNQLDVIRTSAACPEIDCPPGSIDDGRRGDRALDDPSLRDIRRRGP